MNEQEILKLQNDYKKLYNRVDECMEKVDKVQETTNNIDDSMAKIIQLLKGNPLNDKDKGIIGMVFENNLRLTRLERFRDRVIWMVAGGGVCGGWFLSDILTKLFNHK